MSIGGVNDKRIPIRSRSSGFSRGTDALAPGAFGWLLPSIGGIAPICERASASRLGTSRKKPALARPAPGRAFAASHLSLFVDLDVASN
jgi:hypothetical protein